jgi:hypothetical protein
MTNPINPLDLDRLAWRADVAELVWGGVGRRIRHVRDGWSAEPVGLLQRRHRVFRSRRDRQGQDEQRDPHREHVRAVRERLRVQAVGPPTGAVVGGRLSGPFPRIPTLAPRGIEEAARAFGLRAFEFFDA